MGYLSKLSYCRGKHVRTKARARGFTLVEMVVVMMILAVISAVAIPSYQYFAGAARATRLNNYAAAMMSAARMANGASLAAQLGPDDLFNSGDGLAAYNWPLSSEICVLVSQQMSNGPDTALASTVIPGGTPITCNNGVLLDTSASGTNCKTTYFQSTGTGVSAYVDVSGATTANCE